MSAPRKIWADTASLSWVEAYPGQRMNPCEEVYHNDDVVRDLVEALERAEMMMRMRGHLEMADECAAALAKIAQEDRG